VIFEISQSVFFKIKTKRCTFFCFFRIQALKRRCFSELEYETIVFLGGLHPGTSSEVIEYDPSIDKMDRLPVCLHSSPSHRSLLQCTLKRIRLRNNLCPSLLLSTGGSVKIGGNCPGQLAMWTYFLSHVCRRLEAEADGKSRMIFVPETGMRTFVYFMLMDCFTFDTGND